MNVKLLFLASHPFIDAYIQSDFLGKLIFLALGILSVISWVILIYKVWLLQKMQQKSQNFRTRFLQSKHRIFEIDLDPAQSNPFWSIYSILKRYSIDLLDKNRKFSTSGEKQSVYLSPSDLDFVGTHLYNEVAMQIKHLEKNLFILATIVSLAPFLGLLGTVWGILTSFSEMQINGGSQAVLAGLSMALATTVLGLVDAIPALVGYSFIKNKIREFQTDMDGFATEMLATAELQYRKVDG
jgi:biopolymer transport protein TolQ